MSVFHKLKTVAIPMLTVFLIFGLYIGLSFTCSYLFSQGSVVVPAILSDLITIIAVGFLYWRLVYIVKAPVPRYRFSGVGWACLLLVFVTLYLFTQAAGHYVGVRFPSEHLATYTDMSNQDYIWYILLSVTLAPVAEELIFRGFFYQYLRNYLPMGFCMGISAALFAAIHGTTAHIPVAVGLTVFICLLYEWTHNFRYCIGFHMLYNLLSLAYILQVPLTELQTYLGCGVLLVILMLGFVFLDTLRTRLQKGGMPSLESYVDAKRADLRNVLPSDNITDAHSGSYSDVSKNGDM